MRIVSLLPSATEILCEVGLGDYLVGVSHGCDYPSYVTSLPSVTRSLISEKIASADIDHAVSAQLKTNEAIYQLDQLVLESLRPDIIVTQSLCEVCAVAASEVSAAACQLPNKAEVLNLEPMSLQDVFDTMQFVGEVTGTERSAKEAIQRLIYRLERVKTRAAGIPQSEKKQRVVLLEWIDPLFNSGHWTPELVEYAGGVEIAGNKHQPSMRISHEDLHKLDPDVIFIACCGFDVDRTLQDMPILAADPIWNGLTAVKSKRVYIVDGNAYFSRPGPRLIEGLELMANALYPDYHPSPQQLTPLLNYYMQKATA